jgi:hypothetical protein
MKGAWGTEPHSADHNLVRDGLEEQILWGQGRTLKWGRSFDMRGRLYLGKSDSVASAYLFATSRNQHVENRGR